MKKKTKWIGGIFVCAIFIVGCVVWFWQKNSLREQAYQRCLSHVSGAEKEQLEKYCNCVVDSPKGILDNNLYKEWLSSYGKDGQEAEDKFVQYDKVNEKLEKCFVKYAPLSTWLHLGKLWCTEGLGEEVNVCWCMLVTVAEEGEGTLKNMIAAETGLFPIPDETEESVQEREEMLSKLIAYCREYPFDPNTNNTTNE